MEVYKNILIRETRTNVINGIKAIIDYLSINDYNTYEVIIEMAELNGSIVYKTCLAEDNDRYMGISAHLPETFDVVVHFSAPTETHNNNDVIDFVYNCNNIMQATDILRNYYSPADMSLISSIEIKQPIN